MTKPKSPGRPPIYGEPKMQLNFQVSREASEALTAEADKRGISKNELLETILRERYKIVDNLRNLN